MLTLCRWNPIHLIWASSRLEYFTLSITAILLMGANNTDTNAQMPIQISVKCGDRLHFVNSAHAAISAVSDCQSQSTFVMQFAFRCACLLISRYIPPVLSSNRARIWIPSTDTSRPGRFGRDVSLILRMFEIHSACVSLCRCLYEPHYTKEVLCGLYSPGRLVFSFAIRF